MTNDARRVGSQFETDIVGYLRNCGMGAERLAKAGKLDEGDVSVSDKSSNRYILELKVRRDRKSSLNLGSWLEEAHRERDHYRTARSLVDEPQAILVVKNPGKSIGKAFVVQYLEDWISGMA